MNERATEYRTKLEDLRNRGGGRWRTPAKLRDEITVWVAKLRSEGYAIGVIASAIGLSESTLGRWMSPRESTGQIRRIRLAAEPKREAAGRLVVITPGGYRLEGLSVDEAVDVLRRL